MIICLYLIKKKKKEKKGGIVSAILEVIIGPVIMNISWDQYVII